MTSGVCLGGVRVLRPPVWSLERASPSASPCTREREREHRGGGGGIQSQFKQAQTVQNSKPEETTQSKLVFENE